MPNIVRLSQETQACREVYIGQGVFFAGNRGVQRSLCGLWKDFRRKASCAENLILRTIRFSQKRNLCEKIYVK